MSISRLEFKDAFFGWELAETVFSDFNLLVGKSGVGKTRILSVFRALRVAGTRNVRGVNGCGWSVDIAIGDKCYTWKVQTSLVEKLGPARLVNDGEDEDSSRNPVILSEYISEKGSSKPIVRRSQDSFDFGEKSLPKLKNDTSAIALLQDEDELAPLYTALRRIVFSEAGERPHVFPFFHTVFDKVRLDGLKEMFTTLRDLQEAQDVPMLERAYILQHYFGDVFKRLTLQYSAIFPTVQEVRVGERRTFEPDNNSEGSSRTITMGVKEQGVDGWIVVERLSSGMYRTLIHLLELELAPPGTIVIIDELENGLGVNCLNEIVQCLIERSAELQFVVTSHHPYVINSVPINRWRLVTRKGSVITVKDERVIRALQGNSAQDRFIRLINLSDYEDGIQ